MYLSLLKEMFVYIFVTEAKETIKIGTEIFICESMRIKNIHTYHHMYISCHYIRSMVATENSHAVTFTSKDEYKQCEFKE